jgi:hypothetical protein
VQGRIIGAMKTLVVHSRGGCNPLARNAQTG